VSTRRRVAAVNGVELVVTESGDAGAPPLLLSHGFPEGAYSWRHQMEPLAAAGYHVLAPDQRGYGHSSAPRSIDAYGIEQLVGDLLALLDETGHDTCVLVGHDWGALIAWDLVRLHPERVSAVVGVSVPFVNWPAPPLQLMRAMAGDRFFYIVYFQEVGPPEAEMEADTRRTMARFLWSGSSEGRAVNVSRDLPAVGTGVLDLIDDPPAELPAWLSSADIDHYAAEFAHSGFFGPVSYYRNLDANYERVRGIPPSVVSMPSFFIAGVDDMVLTMDPGGVDRMRDTLPDFRGAVLIPGAGHWVQQETPKQFNDALLGFLLNL
jgi:pimeloyl-ACP methyl ester carboxylesterase